MSRKTLESRIRQILIEQFGHFGHTPEQVARGIGRKRTLLQNMLNPVVQAHRPDVIDRTRGALDKLRRKEVDYKFKERPGADYASNVAAGARGAHRDLGGVQTVSHGRDRAEVRAGETPLAQENPRWRGPGWRGNYLPTRIRRMFGGQIGHEQLQPGGEQQTSARQAIQQQTVRRRQEVGMGRPKSALDPSVQKELRGDARVLGGRGMRDAGFVQMKGYRGRVPKEGGGFKKLPGHPRQPVVVPLNPSHPSMKAIKTGDIERYGLSPKILQQSEPWLRYLRQR